MVKFLGAARGLTDSVAGLLASSYETGTLGLTLTRFEREYYDHQFASEREREASSPCCAPCSSFATARSSSRVSTSSISGVLMSITINVIEVMFFGFIHSNFMTYFAESVKNSSNTALLGDTEDQEAAETEEEKMQVAAFAEEDLLTRFVKELRKFSIKTREAELLSSYDEIYSSQQLFQRSSWSHNEDMFATSAQCSLISAGILHDPNITSDFIAMCVKNADVGKEVTKEAAGAKKGGRTYVKIVKDGEEEDITEVATNSDGF